MKRRNKPASLRILEQFLKCMHTKHEIIPCDRCGTGIECKANSYTKCQCSVVQLNLNEVQYISENYEGCMCANCLLALQQEYRVLMGISVAD